jgi:hypothetical protein
MNTLIEYTNKHYTLRQQADAAQVVARNIYNAIQQAKRQAEKSKTAKSKERNLFNVYAFTYNYNKQVERALQLEMLATEANQ